MLNVGHPLRELKSFITSKSGVGNSFSCLWDWNMLVARRIKGVFHDSNYLQHFDYLSTAPKRFKKKYPIQQGFPKDSQDYLVFFIHQTRKPFSRDFFVRIDPNKRPPFWLGGNLVHGARSTRCQFVESLLFVRIHPFSSIHFCFFC